MQYSKLKISAEATSRLRSLRQRTRVTPNLLCRAALFLSLEEGSVTSLAPDEEGQEFNAYTLTGERTGLVGAMIRFVEMEDRRDEPDDAQLVKLLAAHIHRGVGTLAVRVKSPADLGRLATQT